MAFMEAILVPGLLLTSITLDIVTMCSHGWVLGYHGDVVVLQLSPWSLCRLNCLHCAQEKPSFGCYAMRDWSDAQLDLYRLAVHLHYWTLVLVGLGLLTGLFNSAETFLRQYHLPVRCGKLTLILLATASFLSIVVVGVVGLKSSQDAPPLLSSFSPSSSLSSSLSSSQGEDDDIQLSLGWPYVARLLSISLLVLASSAVAYRLCRSAEAVQMAALASPGAAGGSLDCIIDVNSVRDADYDSVDEVENGSLL